MRKASLKKLFEQFSISRKLDLINRKTHSIDPASIEQQSSQAYSNQIFNRNFDQSKIWKNQFFEKQSILMQKLLKAQCLMNKMREYEIKSFQNGFSHSLRPIQIQHQFFVIFPQIFFEVFVF